MLSFYVTSSFAKPPFKLPNYLDQFFNNLLSHILEAPWFILLSSNDWITYCIDQMCVYLVCFINGPLRRSTGPRSSRHRRGILKTKLKTLS